MANVEIPEGFKAVVVLMSKTTDDAEIKFHGVPEGDEHLAMAEAISTLASAQAEEIDSLIDEQATDEEEPEGEEPEPS